MINPSLCAHMTSPYCRIEIGVPSQPFPVTPLGVRITYHSASSSVNALPFLASHWAQQLPFLSFCQTVALSHIAPRTTPLSRHWRTSLSIAFRVSSMELFFSIRCPIYSTSYSGGLQSLQGVGNFLGGQDWRVILGAVLTSSF